MPGKSGSVPARPSMKRRSLVLLLAGVIKITQPNAGSAHHAISADFNGKQQILLAGSITKVSWSNPHAFFYVDVKDPKAGTVVNWACELGSPNMLATLGWTHATLKTGMNVSFTGIP